MANKGKGMVTSVIDFNGVEVYEAGALLITLLAYPREKEEVWAQVHASLCSYALRIKSASEPDRATVATTDKADLCISPGRRHQSVFGCKWDQIPVVARLTRRVRTSSRVM
jgi:hypothetical protein